MNMMSKDFKGARASPTADELRGTLAAMWVLGLVLLLFAYGAVELVAHFPPRDHRLAFSLVCVATLWAVATLCDCGKPPR